MACKIMKYLMKYKVDNEAANTTIEIIRGTKGKNYFIDFK